MKSGIAGFWKVGVALALIMLMTESRTAAQPQQFGRTIAGITVGRDSIATVRSLYGSGAENTINGILTLCYHFTDGGYLSVSTFEHQSEIRSVTLTTLADITPGCHDAIIERKSPSGPNSIQLGYSLQKVILAVGNPLKSGTLQAGSRQLEYADYPVAGGHAVCQFEHDKLIMIAVELN